MQIPRRIMQAMPQTQSVPSAAAPANPVPAELELLRKDLLCAKHHLSNLANPNFSSDRLYELEAARSDIDESLKRVAELDSRRRTLMDDQVTTAAHPATEPRTRYEDVAPEGRRISDVGGESSLVQTLSTAMLAKLAKNRGKGHWQDAAPTYLIDRLRQEVEELEKAIGGYLEDGSADENDVWAEAADVANFAAMLADNATGRAEGAAPRAEGLPSEPRWEEWARLLAPLVHDGLIDTPQEQQIIDKAFYLARLLDKHLTEGDSR